MLKGIPSLLQPELLKILAEMGHGDEIVIGDRNFAAASLGERCVRCDGHSATAVLDAILQLFPLDPVGGPPAILMAPVEGSGAEEPYIWEDFKRIVKKHEPDREIDELDRLSFYDRTREAYATVQTGETAPYGCIVLRKGVVVNS